MDTEEAVIHELVHVLLAEMVDQHSESDFQAHKEKTTVRLARVFKRMNGGEHVGAEANQ